MTKPILDPNHHFVSSQLVEGSFLGEFRVADLNMQESDNQRVLEGAY